MGQEQAPANHSHGQTRFSPAFENETRQVDRVDDVSRLELVETAPDEPRRAGTNVEA
jgi:hypothetical protein